MLLWSGQVVSAVGSEITYVAYPLLVLALTHSPAKAGLTGFCVTLPWLLFTLPAGALVDRWDRKRVMIAADLGRALALGSVAVALWLDRLTFVQILIAAAIEGTLFVFFFVGERAALRNVVPSEQMTTAMAQNEARFFGASLVGSPIGGALFGLGRAVPFLVDAISYLASTVGLLLIRKQFQEERTAARRPLHVEIAEGFAWLWRHRFLRTCSLIRSASLPVTFATILSMIVIAEKHGATSGQVGVMLGIAAGGGLAGSFVTPAIVRRLSIRAIVVASPWLQAFVLPGSRSSRTRTRSARCSRWSGSSRRAGTRPSSCTGSRSFPTRSRRGCRASPACWPWPVPRSGRWSEASCWRASGEAPRSWCSPVGRWRWRWYRR